MPIVACPVCGEDDDLSGGRDGEVITITCGACNAAWERDTVPTCRLCGSTDLQPPPNPPLGARDDLRTLRRREA